MMYYNIIITKCISLLSVYALGLLGASSVFKHQNIERFLRDCNVTLMQMSKKNYA